MGPRGVADEGRGAAGVGLGHWLPDASLGDAVHAEHGDGDERLAEGLTLTDINLSVGMFVLGFWEHTVFVGPHMTPTPNSLDLCRRSIDDGGVRELDNTAVAPLGSVSQPRPRRWG